MNRCQYEHNEKDAILMRHEVTTHENPNTVHGVDFVYYGDQGLIFTHYWTFLINFVFSGSNNSHQYSAMAQTVGYPCAIAAHLVLEGTNMKKYF